MAASLDPTTTQRSRRAVIVGALGGVAGLLAGRLGRPDPAAAAAGSALIIGSEANNSGTANTQLIANSDVVTFKLYQTGPGTALMGYTTTATGLTRGVYGRVDSPNGDGVQGRNAGAAGTGAAVRAYGGNNDGVVATTDNGGRYAVNATGGNGTAIHAVAIQAGILAEGYRGVHGYTSSTGASAGVYGENVGTGSTYGVYGRATGTNDARGVFGDSTGTSGVNYGVYGRTASSTTGTAAIYGNHSTTVTGVGSGVYGTTGSANAVGVQGKNTSNAIGTGSAMLAAGGINTGLVVSTTVKGSQAIVATNTATGLDANAGVVIRALSGTRTVATDIHPAGFWHPAAGEFAGAVGLIGGGSNGGTGVGVVGYSGDFSGVGVYGRATGAGTCYGVVSEGDLRANGDAQITGTLSKSGGSFRIDHPLDPANKYLLHSFVESPDMMNVYNGNVTLDARGEATVRMPAWFEALNREFRYQLTPMGRFAPVYVKAGIASGAFAIAGGEPGQTVSWQVTGIRRDAWAEANRIPVEVAKKADERGRYLHPEVHGKPASAAMPLPAASRAAIA